MAYMNKECVATFIGDKCIRFAGHPGKHQTRGGVQWPNFPRASQNQTVSGGVEGAHESNTADKNGESREPEKLNNAHKPLLDLMAAEIPPKFVTVHKEGMVLKWEDETVDTTVTIDEEGASFQQWNPKTEYKSSAYFEASWALAESSLSSPPLRYISKTCMHNHGENDDIKNFCTVKDCECECHTASPKPLPTQLPKEPQQWPCPNCGKPLYDSGDHGIIHVHQADQCTRD